MTLGQVRLSEEHQQSGIGVGFKNGCDPSRCVLVAPPQTRETTTRWCVQREDRHVQVPRAIEKTPVSLPGVAPFLSIVEPLEKSGIVQRAGLLHGVAQVVNIVAAQQAASAAELCAKYGESDEVVEAISSLHPNAECRSVEAMLVHTANRLSESRPGARKENLAVFIERLKRLESIATGFEGVDHAYAVKAGKEIRVILDATRVGDDAVYRLSKKIARTLEKELNYPGQIKVSVIRETRAVRYAL